MSSSRSRDVPATPSRLLRSVLTTKSSVVDRLSSRLEQLVSVVGQAWVRPVVFDDAEPSSPRPRPNIRSML